MATVKFWQGMDKASNIVGADKMMIGKNETGEAQYVDFQDANQFLSIQGIEMKPVPAGALPAGPTGQTRTMEILEAGTWTFGGNSFVNPSGSIMKLWWDGTTWSLGSSVPLPNGQGLLPLFDSSKVGGYMKDAQVRDADGVTYVSLKNGNTSDLSNYINWRKIRTSISEWTAKIYVDKAQVFKDGTIFELNDGVSASASDVPGVSNKWTVKTIDSRIVNYNTYRGQKISVKRYNISALYPTSGLSGTNKYDLVTALNVLQADLTSEEKAGYNFEISFLNNDSLTENYTYINGGFSTPNSWVKSIYIDKNLGSLYGLHTANVNSASNESLSTVFTVNAGDKICFVPLNNILTTSTIRVNNGSMVVQKSNLDTTRHQFIDITTTGVLNILSNSGQHLTGLARFLIYKIENTSITNDNLNKLNSIDLAIKLNGDTFSKGYTNNRLFNDAIRELFIEGADYPNKTYRIEIIRNRTSDSRWSVILLENGVIVARYNTITSNPESIEVLKGVQEGGSVVNFYIVMNWDALQNDSTYTLATGYNVTVNELAFKKRFNPIISNYLNASITPNIEIVDPKKFTQKISNIAWSGFIDLSQVDEIIYDIKRVYGNIIMYFYVNDASSYADPLLNADYTMATTSTSRAVGRIQVPRKYRYMSFRSDDINNDKMLLIKNPSKNAFDYKLIDKILGRSECISDGYFQACGEPTLLYDETKGIVYHTYICGEEYKNDPNGSFGFCKFPLTQPNRAIYSTFKFNDDAHLIDGAKASFRDVTVYFKDGGIRVVTFGKSAKTGNVLGVHYFDMTTNGEKSNWNLVNWSGGGVIDYNSYITKVTSFGCTPYGLTPAQESDPHFKELWLSASKPQLRNGYMYFSLNATSDCPMICRTNDNFATIEVFKVFQVNGSYESSLLINGNDWYYTIRVADGIQYSQSIDNGLTWTTLEVIENSTGSKPRGLMYDGKPLFLIATKSPSNFGSSQIANKDAVSVSNRYSVMFIRGDKTININSWKKEIVLASKYGLNYADIFTINKDLYYAYSCDKTHLNDLPIMGKSQIMFTRIGNLDNANVFGDI